MKKSHIIFFSLMAIMLLYVSYDMSKRSDMAKIRRAIGKQMNEGISTTVARSVASVSADSKPVVPFIDQFKKEAHQISKIQTNPDLAEARIKELAKKMRPQDVDSMYEVMSNDKIDGDQRAMAVELLSAKNDTTSLMALQNFVANNVNINGQKWDRKKEFETILRAQAVESIATYPQKEIALSTLSYLQQKVDSRFLSERIGRATAQITLNQRTLKEQDEEALKKLVE